MPRSSELQTRINIKRSAGCSRTQQAVFHRIHLETRLLGTGLTVPVWSTMSPRKGGERKGNKFVMSSVKITLDGGRVVSGKVLAVDPVTSTLVVQGDQGYSLVNPNTIVSIDGTLDDVLVPNISEYGLK